MTKGKIGKFIELSPEDIEVIKKASGVPADAKGALVWGVRNLIKFWVANGRPVINDATDASPPAP